MFSKPEINILIVGLDHAGKTVRRFLLVCRALERPARWLSVAAGAIRQHSDGDDWLVHAFQTILEQLKGLYQKSHTVITPERIPPTVGMNSCVLVSACVPSFLRCACCVAWVHVPVHSLCRA